MLVVESFYCNVCIVCIKVRDQSHSPLLPRSPKIARHRRRDRMPLTLADRRTDHSSPSILLLVIINTLSPSISSSAIPSKADSFLISISIVRLSCFRSPYLFDLRRNSNLILAEKTDFKNNQLFVHMFVSMQTYNK